MTREQFNKTNWYIGKNVYVVYQRDSFIPEFEIRDFHIETVIKCKTEDSNNIFAICESKMTAYDVHTYRGNFYDYHNCDHIFTNKKDAEKCSKEKVRYFFNGVRNKKEELMKQFERCEKELKRLSKLEEKYGIRDKELFR